MKKKPFGRHGSVTLFLCIILAAAVFLESIYLKGAYQRKQEVLLTQAVSHQVEQHLSQFDRDYLDWYGIYVLDDVEADHAVFDEMTKEYSDMSFEYDLIDEFSDHDLKIAVSEYMRLRGLAFEGTAILDRLGISLSQLSGMNQFRSTGIGTWLPSLEEYLKHKDSSSGMMNTVVEICKNTGIDDKLDYFYDFMDELGTAWERNSSAMLEVGDTSSMLSLFDPESIYSVTSIFDGYMDYQLPSVVDRLLINEYAVFSFDSRVDSYEGVDGAEEEANIIGIPFSEIHDEKNRPDLEYLLVGSDKASVNKNVSFGFIAGTRLLLDMSAYLMDDTKRSIALGIAEVLCVLIAIMTAFTVILEPTVIMYAILFMMAFIRALSDTAKLIAGETVPLFYNDAVTSVLGDFADTTYRDYFRVFLLFVPENILLSRMNDVIHLDCGEHLYTGVDAKGTLRDTKYQVRRRFELYEMQE